MSPVSGRWRQPPAECIIDRYQCIKVLTGQPAGLIINNRIFKIAKPLGLLWTLKAAKRL